MAQGNDSTGSRSPFNCSQCDKIFNIEDDMRNHEKSCITCPYYLESTCEFGAKGENDKGQCPFAHPRKCIYFQNNNCRKGVKCNFLHMKFNRKPFFNENPSRGHPHQGGYRGSNPIISELSSFLGHHFSEIRERIGKLEDKNNNFSGSQMQMNRRYH